MLNFDLIIFLLTFLKVFCMSPFLDLSFGLIERPFRYIKNKTDYFSSPISSVALLSLMTLSVLLSYCTYRKFTVKKMPLPVTEDGVELNQEQKKFSYPEEAFTTEKLAKCFEEKPDLIKGEDQQVEQNSLPENIEQILDGDCPIFPGKKVRETHLLVRIPKKIDGENLTLRKLGLLAIKFFPKNETGYRFFIPSITDKFGDECLDKSRWVLMTKEVIPGSRNKSYKDQQALVLGIQENTQILYRIPKTLEVSYCVLTHYFRSGECLLGQNPWTFTRCQETIKKEDGIDCQVLVGGFCSPDPQSPDPQSFGCGLNLILIRDSRESRGMVVIREL